MKNKFGFLTTAKVAIGTLFFTGMVANTLNAQGRGGHENQQQRQPQQQNQPQQQRQPRANQQQRQPQVNQQQRQPQTQQQRQPQVNQQQRQPQVQQQNRQQNQNRPQFQNQNRAQNQNRQQFQNQSRPGNNYRPGNNSRPGYNGGNRGNFSFRRPTWNANRPSYVRPPHVYNGRSYYSYNPYFNHAYRPRVYGSFWHPIGFTIGVLATTAILVSLNNNRYYYDQGVYYAPDNGSYQVVAAPVGAFVPNLPPGYANLNVNGYDYYYFAGTFYIRGSNGGYEVTDAPPGAVVYNLPEGCTPVNFGGIDYLTYNDVYYQPIQYNGENAYEVVDVE